jgi:hypothetical protein
MSFDAEDRQGAARGFPRAALQGQLEGQAFLRFAGVSPSSKDSTTASVASASSEAATVRALTAMRSKAAAVPIPTSGHKPCNPPELVTST